MKRGVMNMLRGPIEFEDLEKIKSDEDVQELETSWIGTSETGKICSCKIIFTDGSDIRFICERPYERGKKANYDKAALKIGLEKTGLSDKEVRKAMLTVKKYFDKPKWDNLTMNLNVWSNSSHDRIRIYYKSPQWTNNRNSQPYNFIPIR